MKILVQVKPGSKIEKIEKIGKDLLTNLDIYSIKTKAKPIKGQANKEIIEIISKFFNIPKYKIKIEKGNTSKYKLINIEI